MNIFEKGLRYLVIRHLFLKNHPQNSILVFNDWIGLDIISFGLYEKNELETLKNHLNKKLKGKTFLDIGSNIGNHSIFMSAFFKNVKAFEPQLRTFKVLQLNTKRIKNIEIFNYGIDEFERKTIFNIPFHNVGEGSEYKDFKNSFKEEVLLKPLGPEFSENVGMIKIDVEGNEYGVLKTLTNVIAKSSPLITIELHNNHFKRTEILHFLKSNGYKDVFVLKIPKNKIQRIYYNIFSPSKKLIKLDINNILNANQDFNFLTFQKEKDDKIVLR